jgi:hypothetical protein
MKERAELNHGEDHIIAVQIIAVHSTSIVGTGKLHVDTETMKGQPRRSILKTPETSHENSSCGTKHCREVKFHSIEVRKYPICLGDNPSCSIGPPVTLAWEYEEEPAIDLDVYECEHIPHHRHLRHLVLNYYRRHDILINAGYSELEIKQASQACAKAQRQRSRTRFLDPVSKLDEIVHSAGRKVKRAVFRIKKKK